MTSREKEDSLQEQMRKIDQVVQHLETVDPDARTAAKELVQLLMDLNSAGLERVLEIISQSGMAGEDILNRCTHDPLAASLLLLYGLHPVDLETRVKRALEQVRPLLHSHGGDVELLGIHEGFVRLRLQGSCHGCPSSAATLKQAIEEALYEWTPDIVGLDVAGVVAEGPPAVLVQLGQMRPNVDGDQRSEPLGTSALEQAVPLAPELVGAPRS